MSNANKTQLALCEVYKSLWITYVLVTPIENPKCENFLSLYVLDYMNDYMALIIKIGIWGSTFKWKNDVENVLGVAFTRGTASALWRL